MNFELTTTAPEREGDTLTMTSREIADLVGARHNDLIATIERQIDGGVLRVSRETRRPLKMGEKGGRPTMVYDLGKRDTLIVVSGYDDALRAKVIDRWIELETKIVAAPAIQFDPTDPQVLLQVFGALQSKVQEQQAVIAAQAEDVDRVRRLEATSGAMCITDAAKTLKVRRIELTSRMQGWRWIYKRAGNASWLSYQDKIQAGLMEHRDHIYMDADGNERVATRALITGRGLAKLAGLLNKPLH